MKLVFKHCYSLLAVSNSCYQILFCTATRYEFGVSFVKAEVQLGIRVTTIETAVGGWIFVACRNKNSDISADR